VCCVRHAPRIPELARLLDALEFGGAQRLLVGPLTDAAVLQMVAQTVSAQPGSELLAEISGAAGNPLFIVELLAALRQEGLIKTVGKHADLESSGVPPTLRLTVLRRLSFLPDATLQALRGAAILGSSFSLTDLSVATGRPAAVLAGDLDEAIRAHVIHDDGTALRFRHDLIREVLYADVPVDMRRALHGESGQRLGQAGAPVLQVAEQFANGATMGDAEASGG
jgi:predicted ATPase